MKYHGNYCGPNWSAGQHQPSVVSDVPAVDEFDDTCRVHDAAYARGDDLLRADLDFFHANIGGGPKAAAAALAVGAQAVIRAIDKQIPKVYKNQEMTKNLRGPPTTVRPKSMGSTNPQTTMTTVPAAYGFTLRMSPPNVSRKGDQAIISGADFASPVRVANSANYEPAASVLLNPAYFQNAMLGSMARAYEKFRFRKATLQYIPSVSTNTQGQLIMTCTSTVKEPFLPGDSSTFLSRALSQGNAVATPLWRETSIDIPVSDSWSIVDTLLDGDLDDSIDTEIQVYATASTAGTAGILLLHYQIEFRDPLYVFHPTLIPIPKGNGTFVTFSDDSAVNAISDVIILGAASIPFTESYGSVYRLIFQQALSNRPTGPATWGAVARINQATAITTTGQNSSFTNLNLSPGTVLYGMLSANGISLYGSYEAAVQGDLTGSVFYQTATTASGTWAFICEMVRLGLADRVTAQ